MGAEGYLDYINRRQPTVVEIFEQFSPPTAARTAPTPLDPGESYSNSTSGTTAVCST
jgi:hypothetical protein